MLLFCLPGPLISFKATYQNKSSIVLACCNLIKQVYRGASHTAKTLISFLEWILIEESSEEGSKLYALRIIP
jgi:hypothetical protein